MSTSSDNRPNANPSSPSGNGTPAQIVTKLEISPDFMEARLSVNSLGGPSEMGAVQEKLAKLLRDKGVKYGLRGAAIKEALERVSQGQDVADILVASGDPPLPGEDAEIILLAEIPEPRVGATDELGNIDFRDRGPQTTVMPGAPLAKLKPEVKGQAGKDIRGRAIKPPEVRRYRLHAGQGTTLEAEGGLVTASVQGIFHPVGPDTFEVQEIMYVDGDVDLKTGHIDFPGLVRVRGAVLSDFKVKAKALEAEELEPGSQVTVEGDLTVMGGIMGAKVTSGGNVTARFIRDSQIECDGDLKVESEIVQCKARVGGQVTMVSSQGRVVNSQIAAVVGVTAGELVSTGVEPTLIQLGVSKEMDLAFHELRRKIRSLEDEQIQLGQLMEGQREELVSTETELRDLITQVKSAAQQEGGEAAVDNLKAQIGMIKPLRETLKEGVLSGEERLEEIAFDLQLARDELTQVAAKMPVGLAWLDVRGRADAAIQIKGRHASLVLDRTYDGLSARELPGEDPDTGKTQYKIRLSGLRRQAQ